MNVLVACANINFSVDLIGVFLARWVVLIFRYCVFITIPHRNLELIPTAKFNLELQHVESESSCQIGLRYTRWSEKALFVAEKEHTESGRGGFILIILSPSGKKHNKTRVDNPR